MYKYSIKILSIAIILVILLQCKSHYSTDSNEVDIENAPIDVSQLKATRITPILDAKINTGENLIYCSTFQITWNSLYKDIYKGETIEIENAPNYIKTLNSLINEPCNISEDSYVALAGFVKDGIVDKINEKLKGKFAFPIYIQNQMSVILFSYFYKEIIFEYEFEKNKVIPHYFYFGTESVSIETFGGIFVRNVPSIYTNNSNSDIFKNHSLFLPQIRLIYANELGEPPNLFCDYFPHGFIIELISKSKDEEIIISSIKPDVTLLKSYESISNVIQDIESNKMIRNKYGKYPLASELIKCLGNCDGVSTQEIESQIKTNYYLLLNPRGFIHLFVPKIKFNIINALQILNQNNKTSQYNVIESHNINFNFCGKGIQKNKYISVNTMTGTYDTNLNLIGPFIIYIRKKSSATPYFMAYIGNAELLIKSDLNYDDFMKNYNKE